MSRRKRGNPVHGWVVLDKPLGMTSTQAVGAVRRLFDAQKAGHAGTLDPLATGILPIALGDATKTVPIRLFENAFRFFDLGYPAAIGLMMLVVTILISMAFVNLLAKED